MAYNNNINIPATLVHKVNGIQYKLNGTIIAINESNDTCTMRFKTGIESGIPMEKLYINEGFIDTLKNIKQSFRNWIAKKVKGFYVLVDKAGNVVQNSVNNILNIAKAYTDGQFSDAIQMCYSDKVARTMGLPRTTIDDLFYDTEEKEINDANTFFERIMNRYGSTDETLEESAQYVYKRYYKSYKSLNEGSTGGPVPQIADFYKEELGVPMHAGELQSAIYESIRLQMDPNTQEKSKIPFIWGAPGIGKTSIIKQAINDYKTSENGLNLNLSHVNLANMTGEDFNLPGKTVAQNVPEVIKASSMGQRGEIFPMSWIPVYKSDKANRDYWDNYINTGQWSGDTHDEYNNAYDGGIVFFDEYTRVGSRQVYNTLMALIFDRVYGNGWHVASKWGFIVAANRATDDWVQYSHPNYYISPAQKDRFVIYTYVPTKNEWLRWAKQINSKHQSRVNPLILAFIDTYDEGMWYATVVGGSYSHLSSGKGGTKYNEIKTRGQAENYMSNDEDTYATTSLFYSPRTWVQVTDAYRSTLRDLFGERTYQEMVDKSLVQKKSKVTDKYYKDYMGDISDSILREYLSKISNAKFEKWYTSAWEKRIDPLPDEIDEETFDQRDPEQRKKVHRIFRKNGEIHGEIDSEARYQILQAVLKRIIGEQIKDPAITKNNDITPPQPSGFMVNWNDFSLYAQVFTSQAIAYIGKNGQLPETKSDYLTTSSTKDVSIVEDDSLYYSSDGGYANTVYSKWKQYGPIIKKICDMLIDFDLSIPDLDEIMNKDIDVFVNYANTHDIQNQTYDELYREFKNEIDKLNKHYVIELTDPDKKSKKTINILEETIEYIKRGKKLVMPDKSVITFTDKDVEYIVTSLYRTLVLCETARRLCNIVLYLAKIKQQTRKGQTIFGIRHLLGTENGLTAKLSPKTKNKYNDKNTKIINLDAIVKAKTAKDQAKINVLLSTAFDAPALYMAGYVQEKK